MYQPVSICFASIAPFSTLSSSLLINLLILILLSYRFSLRLILFHLHYVFRSTLFFPMKIHIIKTSESDLQIFDYFERAFPVHILTMDSCYYEEIFRSVDRIVDLNNSLCDIVEAQCHALAQSLGCNRYNYGHGIMMVCLCHAVNLEVATYDSAVPNIYDKRLLKQGCFLVMLGRPNWHCSVKCW